MKDHSDTAETRVDADIYTVSRLNREARQLLERALPGLWVAGEISNLARPGSGHIYFSLKDADAQVSCAMFRADARKLAFQPKDGVQVLLKARVSIYEARGSYQLIVSQMEDAGEGLLRRRFEELKARLSKEGLFAEDHKQPLPALPACIGIVTSPSGAAIRDILHVLARRYPIARIIIYPTRVQGDGASAEIIRAIKSATQRSECDVLIIARGGGSLEDLWCFNEETVARAVHACPLPVIAGIGHEVDFTITDLVADVRAPTPSGAAELAVPDRGELLQGLRAFDRRLLLSAQRHLSVCRQLHSQLHARLERSHPGAVLRQLQQRADDLTRQMSTAVRTLIIQQKMRYQALRHDLHGASPAKPVARHAAHLDMLNLRLANAARLQLQTAQGRLARAAGELSAVNPLATLERGYAIVHDAATGKALRDAADVKQGDRIQARLARGMIEAVVKKTRPD